MVLSESQVTMSLYLVYGTGLQGNGLLQFFKIPSFSQSVHEEHLILQSK